ncbi:MAG TPA: hypothetical protein VLS91_04710 [Acidimicrobiales bacterium]|nr:hypothetical protein [Acidimicrobiales bacterium]
MLVETSTGLRRALARPFAGALIAYLAARIVTLGVVALSNVWTHHSWVSDLSTWDGAWFLKAVYHGWPSPLPIVDGHVGASPVAFFPLLPLVIRGLAAVSGLGAATVGLLVSGLSGLVAVYAVGILTRHFAGSVKAERAALLFALSPGSFVFSLIYAEGLLLTFIALGLLALLQRRWVLAGVLGALASLTSPVGLAFAASCAVTAFVATWRERDWRSLVAPLLAPMGFIGWMIYLWRHTGTLMAWRETERYGWNSYPSLLYPFRILAKFLFNPLSPTMTGQILFWGTVVAIYLCVLMFREHQPLAVLAYGVSAVVLFAISSPVGLRPRFLMLAFPLTIAAGTRWEGRKFRLALAISVVGLALMTIETLTSWAVFP